MLAAETASRDGTRIRFTPACTARSITDPRSASKRSISRWQCVSVRITPADALRLAKPGDLAGMLQQAGLVDVTDQEFIAEWSYGSADEYYTSLLEIAAPIQNLMAKLSANQIQEVRRLITQAATQYQRGNRITFPLAVRMVAARKPL